MSAPLARGLIIAASVVVAAGIAIMENEQVRRWLDEHRRRIAIALYSLGDGINPSYCEGSEAEERQAEMEQINRERRHEIVRRNREDLIRRAREDGTSVDLDELTALGMLEREAEEDMRRNQSSATTTTRSSTNTNFGDFIGADGKLRTDSHPEIFDYSNATLNTALSAANNSGLRQRGNGARGFASGSAFATNPFGDEMALHDDDAEEFSAEAITQSASIESEPPLSIISPRPVTVEPAETLIRDIPIAQSETLSQQIPVQYKTEDEFNAEIEEAIRRSLQSSNTQQLVDISSPGNKTEPTQIQRSETSTPHSLADSLFEPSSPRSGYASAVESLPTARIMSQTLSPAPIVPHASLAGSYYSAHGNGAEDIETIDAYVYDGERTPMGSGTLTPTDDDAFSTVSATDAAHQEAELVNLAEVRSEAGTNDSYSVVGASTPGTWSEVGSDDDMSEAGDGRMPQLQR